MDKNLATYLFGDEVIFDIKENKTVPENMDAEGENTEVEINEIEEEVAEVIEPEEVLEEETQANEITSATVPMEEEVVCFKMKTHHLLVFNGLKQEERDFLLKILQALDLSFTKVDILDIDEHPLINFKETIYSNTIKSIVYFGADSGKDFLPKLGLEPYVIKNIKNIYFLYSDKLSTVSQNANNEKRKLWENLKLLY